MKTEMKLLIVKLLLELYIAGAVTLIALLVLHRKGCIL